jgi:3-phenylpropionate/trans-cinnamate dioxygenase ferredoxin reductase subunit
MIDAVAKFVLAGGEQYPYEKLLISTGARPRRLPTASTSTAAVTYLRTMDDATRIKAALKPGSRVAIIGGGWIGLEVAAAARGAGSDVTVLERLELPLLPVLGRQVAEIFASLHRENGVDLRVETGASAIVSHGDVTVLHTTDGSSLEADLVVVGIGVVPDVSLAEAAGLQIDNGIVVDQFLQTSDPAIFAAGDVANAYHPLLKRSLRIEHWDNAIGQGRVAGRNMGGEAVNYDRIPYFYTDQYDLGMEYVGNVGPGGYDDVVLRQPSTERAFTAFWLLDGEVLAGMHANDWSAIEPIKTIVGTRPPAGALQDLTMPLEQIAGASDHP